MGKVLHIKDAYFELPEKCKDDIGCMVTLLVYPSLINWTIQGQSINH